MSTPRIPKIPSSAITSEHVWLSRREWIKKTGLSSLALGLGMKTTLAPAASDPLFQGKPNPDFILPNKLTDEDDVSSYNNFYEFGTGKGDPHAYAGRMRLRPWQVSVEGEVARPQVFDIDELLRLAPMEERIYRMRCVEGWSMVIPWEGYSLATLLRKVEPTSNAKFVEFITDLQPENMPGARTRILDWPYTEGLRIDEAMHPLTMLVFGVYGKRLPGANGAPIRVAIPWKYGFKSGKSLVRIRLVENMPATSWVLAAPHEYGFYANVNPTVAHPRWSQATERRIGDGLFAPRAKTLMFNGYAEQVQSMYVGMDLKRYY